MKIAKLSIEGYRGISFREDFSKFATNSFVLSGMNGSGKTTVIEAIDILLSRPSTNLNQNNAASVTLPQAELEIFLELANSDIDFIVENIAMSNPLLNMEEILSKLLSMYLKNNKFRRKITINKQSPNWRVGDDVKEFINGEEKSTQNSEPLLVQLLNNLCIRIDSLEDINVNQIFNLNTRFSIRDIINTQTEEANRKTKTTVDLTSVFSRKINEKIISAANANNALTTVIKGIANYYNEALEPFSIQLDESQFSRTNSLFINLKNPQSATYPINQASSGQKQAIALMSLMQGWAESSGKPVLLMDEPDAGMHPDMIWKVTKTIKKELEGSETTCIIATHSPEVIKSYSANVFRITKNESGDSELSHVTGLEEKVNLLNELGVGFDLGYLVERIIFVESEIRKQKGLSDEEIYQRLVDPEKRSVLFRSGPPNLGGKTDVAPRTQVFNSVIEILQQDEKFNAWSLCDRDSAAYAFEPPKINTPYRNVEYFFITDTRLLSKVLKNNFSIDFPNGNISSFLKQRDNRYPAQKLDVDAKKVWADLLSKLRGDYGFDESDTSALELAVIQELIDCQLASIDKEVKDFLSQLMQ